MEHVSHFNQRIVVHFKDEALMCKVFSSSLGPVAMRWFDSLRVDSIGSFKVLNLKLEDLTTYNSPLVSFDGKVVISRGQIRLLMQSGSKVVEVDFIVVEAYSPYTAIVAKPWLYASGAVSSILHQKVKYPSGGQIEEIVGSQSMARQCLVATILHQPRAESLPSAERGL